MRCWLAQCGGYFAGVRAAGEVVAEVPCPEECGELLAFREVSEDAYRNALGLVFDTTGDGA